VSLRADRMDGDTLTCQSKPCVSCSTLVCIDTCGSGSCHCYCYCYSHSSLPLPLLEEGRRRQANMAIASVVNDIHLPSFTLHLPPPSTFNLQPSTFHLRQNPTCADLPDTSSAYGPKSACSPIVFHTHTQTQTQDTDTDTYVLHFLTICQGFRHSSRASIHSHSHTRTHTKQSTTQHKTPQHST
jgi:hypothetical protein